MSEAERRALGHVRVLRITSYLGMGAAGVILPTVVMQMQGVETWLWLVMCAWLVLGGLIAAVGQLWRRWTGEFVGLPLLFSALTGFGLLQGSVGAWQVSVIPSVALLWSFGLFVYSRWRDVAALYNAARRGTGEVLS